MKILFKKYDLNDKESLTFEQFKSLMTTTFKDLTVNDVSNMFEIFDTDNNNEISLEEFITLISEFQKTPEEQSQELREAFNWYDVNKNGKLNADELLKLLHDFGRNTLTIDDITAIINRFDDDKDGFINYDELKHMISSDF